MPAPLPVSQAQHLDRQPAAEARAVVQMRTLLTTLLARYHNDAALAPLIVHAQQALGAVWDVLKERAA